MNGKKAKRLRKKIKRPDIYSTMPNGQIVNVGKYKYQKAKNETRQRRQTRS